VPPIALDSGECTFNVELHKGKGPAGVVLLPDGQPANGATVWLVEPGQFLRIGDQAQAGHSTAVSVLTEADGTYQFPSVPGAYLLVALHPQGYAEANAEAYAKSPDLRLQAWARVEGVYRIGAQPAVNQTVSIDADPTRNHYGDPRVVHGWNTGTDDQGRFVFEFVAPGRGRIGGPLVKASAHGYQHSRTAHYSVAPGETAQVTMGGTGRPVVGRAVMPEGAKREFDWSGGAGELVSTIRELPGVQKIPDEFDRLPPKERRKRFFAWLKTEDGRKYLADRKRYREAENAASDKIPKEMLHFGVGEDGTFRIEDVPSGNYNMTITFRPKTEAVPGLPDRPVATLAKRVEVADMPGGRSDEPLNLGSLEVVLDQSGAK
jgi:hypothetical protein